MKVLAVIPARLASTRLPNKPLKDIGGQTMIERAWRQVMKSSVSRAVISTDNQEIFDLAKNFGAEVVMTDPALPNGSARVGATVNLIQDNFDLVLNVQGDMPFVSPQLIDQLIEFHSVNESFGMATAATPIYAEEDFLSNSVVKVVVGRGAQGLYFSRSPIPFSRDGLRISEEDMRVISTLDGRLNKYQVKNPVESEYAFGFKHFGIYSFRTDVLKLFENFSNATILSKIENLEQLFLLEQGVRIGVTIVDYSVVKDSIEVDTQADLEKAITQVTSNAV